MPFQLSGGDRKILLIAAAVFIALVLGAMLFVSPASNQESIPTTYSSASSGAKAAFLLLQNQGYRAERFERSPAEILIYRDTTLIIAEPSQYASKDECAALHQFIRRGGRLIAIGPSAAFLLPKNDAQADPMEVLTWEKFPAVAPSQISQAAPQITLTPKATWNSPSSALVLYGKENQAVVIRYPYGEGVVFWWASATPLTNAGIKEPGNLEFFLTCLGDKNKTRILWDEYFHGFGGAKNSSYEAWLLAGMLLQLIILGIPVLLTFSRRSGLLRPSAPESRLSPLEFVETLGGLYHHAKASSIAVDIHYQRFLYWLVKRLRMSRNNSLEEIEQAMRTRWNFHDAEFAGIMSECGSVRYKANIAPRRALKLIRSLYSYAIQLKLYPGSVKENNRWKPFRNY
jgi:hypothetical protein